MRILVLCHNAPKRKKLHTEIQKDLFDVLYICDTWIRLSASRLYILITDYDHILIDVTPAMILEEGLAWEDWCLWLNVIYSHPSVTPSRIHLRYVEERMFTMLPKTQRITSVNTIFEERVYLKSILGKHRICSNESETIRAFLKRFLVDLGHPWVIAQPVIIPFKENQIPVIRPFLADTRLAWACLGSVKIGTEVYLSDIKIVNVELKCAHKSVAKAIAGEIRGHVPKDALGPFEIPGVFGYSRHMRGRFGVPEKLTKEQRCCCIFTREPQRAE